MADNDLLKRLSQLGMPMMETSEEFDANKTLADVVKSHDLRLWEGFPVLLANAARDNRFEYNRVLEYLPVFKEKKFFQALLLLSMAEYDFYHLTFHWVNQLKAKLNDEEKSKLKKLKGFLSGNALFNLSGTQFDPERLKTMFGLYFKEDAGKSRQRKERYEELSLEYAMSQLFSPKQKDLFRKKLDGVSLTKTEKEYFSRAVKKKVVALANADLHRLAQQLLEY